MTFKYCMHLEVFYYFLVFVLFCVVLYCIVLCCLFCFVLFCFVLFCFVLFCFIVVFTCILEQQHAPNKPYQIGTGCEDAPEKGTVEHMKLKAGDMLVFASDGTTSFPNYLSSSSHSLVYVSACTY